MHMWWCDNWFCLRFFKRKLSSLISDTFPFFFFENKIVLDMKLSFEIENFELPKTIFIKWQKNASKQLYAGKYILPNYKLWISYVISLLKLDPNWFYFDKTLRMSSWYIWVVNYMKIVVCLNHVAYAGRNRKKR